MNEITVTEANRRRPTSQILDVREDDEIATGMIPGAIHVPLGQLGQRLSELSHTQPIVVVCRSGRRSAAAATALTGAGFAADTMAGGMDAWTHAGLPTT
ncbi:TPA: rhodanese-like domain-containing protein [Enterococcus faecium]|nr:rhodanese-like domain-containing protein [Enterococcus faecium]HAQ9631261.1 rhodanese-like domain-containing protein [Enterococcus faecium]HAQ9640123.1 rhodanese-like domain-containing protein [Enterococcus faecium]HDY5681462.1 rhodanese-like domain-containing protein [Staphylococcus aureus]